MKKIPGLFIILLFCFVTNAQQNPEVLLKIDNETITKEEFLRFYHKNRINLTTGETVPVDEYLELFINFKLKVIEAKNRGLDTTQSFLSEFEGYQKQLARPYLLDQETLDMLVREAYERKQYEVRASHILIRLREDAAPEDTAFAYKKAVKIQDRILRGEPFSMVAKGVSDDPSVKMNAGDLGYFTVFQMVYPFEDAVYSMDIGDIKGPVRTRFGYHIIRLTDKKEARGEVKVAHIMLVEPGRTPEESRPNPKEFINELYHRIKQGEDFAQLAIKYSDDKGSAAYGGELPWFGVGQMVEVFERAAFALDKNGDISKPVHTNYGWHLIQRIDRKEPKSFAEEKDILRRKVINDQRSLLAQKALIEKLKQEYQFTEHRENLPVVFDSTDNSWKYNEAYFNPDKEYNKTLFAFNHQQFKVKDFEKFVQNNKSGNITPYHYHNLYHRFVNQHILEYEESRLTRKYPEYKYLLKEYHDGMLLFELMDKEVWTKAITDTTGLKDFYKSHKEDYRWGERWEGTLYYCKNEDVYHKVDKEINGRRLFRRKLTPEELLKKFNRDEEVLKIETGIFTRGENEIVDQMVWEDPSEKNDQAKLLIQGDKLKPSIKPFAEAKGNVISDYQEYLEKEWIKKLREKYNIKVNQQVLSTINQ
ncbi:MAG: peptidylprolyl isomerase [Bacteroidales bacterium]|jgi:peptidyl-prolyl cis-trans isomerase SurA|nr:peptidylprolyl isomerase [Bacteroidales bacterium]